MTGIIEVDTQALQRLADRIRSAAAQSRAMAAQASSGALQAQISALSAPCLVRATTGFVESWAGALAELVADADRLADAISLLARGYQDTEAGLARRMIR